MGNILDAYATQVQKTYGNSNTSQSFAEADTTVLQGVATLNNTLGAIAEKYTKAKHISDTNKANVDQRELVQNFMREQRRRPSTRKGNETLLQAREREWDEFSENHLKTFYKNIENKKVADNLEKEWAGQAIDFKDMVMNSAIDEDIAYMHEVAGDSITRSMDLAFNGTDQAEFGKTKREIASEAQAGNISPAERDHYWNQVDKTDALWETNNGLMDPDTNERSGPMDYAEAQMHIEKAGLEADEKTEALAYLKKKEEIRIAKAIDDGMVYHQTTIHDGAYDGMPDNSAHDLLQERMNANNPDFSPQNQEQEHAVLARRIAKNNSKDGKEDDSDPIAYRAVFDAIRSQDVSPEDARTLFLELQGRLSTTDITKLDTMMEKDIYAKEQSMDNYAADAVKRIEAFYKGDDEKAAAAGNMIMDEYDYLKRNATGDDRYKETFTSRDDIDQMVRAQMNKQMLKIIDEDTLEETNGAKHLTDYEILVREGEAGNLSSMTERDLTATFYSQPGLSEAEMKDMYVESTGKGSWKDLTKREQSQAIYSINVAKLAKEGSGFIADNTNLYVRDVVLDNKTSMPIFNVIAGQDGEGNAIITQMKLTYDEKENEERIMAFNPDPAVRDWEVLNIKYRSTEADVGFIPAFKAAASAAINLGFVEEDVIDYDYVDPDADPNKQWSEDLEAGNQYVTDVPAPGQKVIPEKKTEQSYKDNWLGK